FHHHSAPVRQPVFHQATLVHFGGKMLAVAFDIVDCKMFDRGGELEMVEVVSLQTTNIGDAHATREIRIFAEHFLDAPPARIAADINNRRPIYEAMLGSRSL